MPGFIRKLLHVPGLTEEGAAGPFSSRSRWDPVLCSGPQAVAGEWGAGWGSGGSTLSGAVGLWTDFFPFSVSWAGSPDSDRDHVPVFSFFLTFVA